MVSIPGDGEKCKRVNLRCGEKVEKSEKQKAAEGGGGKRGIRYPNICSGFRAGLDFRLIRKSVETWTPGKPRLFSLFHFCFSVNFGLPAGGLGFPSWNKITMRPKIMASFEREDPCLFPLSNYQECIN